MSACQEAEYLVIKSLVSEDAPRGQRTLDRIKSMVISTHSTEIEHRIFAMLCTAGMVLRSNVHGGDCVR